MSKASDDRRRTRQEEWLGHSLENLEGSNWGDPGSGDTELVSDCLRLRRVPVGLLTLGDMRRLLMQGIGTKFLVRRVVPCLLDDPFVEADLFRGDLLSALSLAIKAGLRPEQVVAAEIRQVFDDALRRVGEVEHAATRAKLEAQIREAGAELKKAGSHGANR